MYSVGIDIGHFSVKAIVLEVTANSYQLINFLEFPLSPDPTKDKDIEILEALRNISQKFDSAQTRYIFSVQQKRVSTRPLNFPFKERFKILKSLSFELEDELPLTSEGAIFDARISQYTEDGFADVLAFACPKGAAEEVLQVARDAGIEPAIISVKGAAFSNLFEQWTPPVVKARSATEAPTPKDSHVVLDMGHESTLLLVLKEGRLLEARTIDWGGKDIAEIISMKYNIHYLEALKELRKKSFILLGTEGATKDQIAFSDVIKSAVDRLAQDLKLSLIELQTAHNLHYSQVELVGGVSQIKNLAPYLTQKTELPVNRLKSLKNHPGIDFESGKSNEVLASYALGLALEGVRKPNSPAVNFLKGDLAPENKVLKSYMEKWSHAIAVGVAVFFLLTIYGYVRSSFTSSLSDEAYSNLKKQARDIKVLGKKPKITDIKKFISDVNRQEANRSKALQIKNINSAIDIFKAVSKGVPASAKIQLNIQTFKLEGDVLEIQGYVNSSRNLSALEESLKGISIDGKVTKSAPEISGAFVSFSYKLRVSRFIGGV